MKKHFVIVNVIKYIPLISGGPLLLFLSFSCLNAFFPFPKTVLNEVLAVSSSLILDGRGNTIDWHVDPFDRRFLPVSIENISPFVIASTISAEDKRFFKHSGIDVFALMRATCQNIFTGKRVSGASTITMQTIRLIWPRPRTYRNKIIEMFRAFQLERIASKNEILELYFNLAPYGGNIVGIEAATRRYFNKTAKDLTLGEAALLAGVPQRPAAFNPLTHLNKALKRREFVWKKLKKNGFIELDSIRNAQQQKIIIRPFSASKVPLFSDFIMQITGIEGGVIRTYLAPEIQSRVQEVVNMYSNELSLKGIDGFGLVVIDVKDSKLVASVGTLDSKNMISGWMNGNTVKRQPGSLLKPFIYTQAYDKGILTPQSVLYDLPFSWHHYYPSNMDHKYLGPIPAGKALLLSRNIPAVDVLSKTGINLLTSDLMKMGISTGNSGKHAGLSLALGSEELKLIDLSNAYATIARLGEFRTLKCIQKENQIENKKQRIFSEGACYLTLRSLGISKSSLSFTPASKTGTSWNHKDAWAISMSPSYVVGVWCGILRGNSHFSLIGQETALPISLEVLSQIDPETKNWEVPLQVKERDVCAISGSPKTSSCLRRISAEYLAGKSSDVPCSLHQWKQEEDQLKTITTWPSHLPSSIKLYTETDDSPEPKIDIISPLNGGEYFMPLHENHPSSCMTFTVQTTSSVKNLYWFLNGKHIATTENKNQLQWKMEEGSHTLTISSELGTYSQIHFQIRQFCPLK